MRKIEQAMIEAIRNKKNFTRSNTSVYLEPLPDGREVAEVYLHGNPIASVIFSHRDSSRIEEIRLSDAGWKTVTTKSRLNAVLQTFVPGAYIYQKNYRWYIHLGGKDYRWDDWNGVIEL